MASEQLVGTSVLRLVYQRSDMLISLTIMDDLRPRVSKSLDFLNFTKINAPNFSIYRTNRWLVALLGLATLDG